ncbi:RabGAP/TBC [Metschnikowia bicuspidata]|uniref:RabGAP/TBC n=1 Tax=Metschnikowia bicuspidata TaxID=27322 RepID=A0A4P9ZGC9_9ASCO|nr:RabGAP/TBC [Metschnikowia bicuspidata]
MVPKRKSEMTQVSSNGHNEFVFGEKGGRGKHLLSFLKNLSLTGSLLPSHRPDTPEEINRSLNSSIYGEIAYRDKGLGNSGHILPRRAEKARQLMLQLCDASRLSSPVFRQASSSMNALEHTLRPLSRRSGFADLDDDWDAAIDNFDAPFSALTSESPAIPDLIDLLHPDLVAFDISPKVEDTASQPQLQDQSKYKLQGRVLLDSRGWHAEHESQLLQQKQSRLAKFHKVLLSSSGTVNLKKLRELSWKGIPSDLRALVWQLLLGYLPANKARQAANLKRKRAEYTEGLKSAGIQILFKDDNVISSSVNSSSASLAGPRENKDNSANKEKVLYHQIKIDVKRTNPSLQLYSLPATQQSLKKILYLWAIRHPASGYVQGINDLCTPFYQIFLGNYIWQLQRKAAHLAGGSDDLALFIPGLMDDGSDPDNIDVQEQALLQEPKLMSYTAENFDPALLSESATALIEADTYWCLSKLLENITDNYIHEQPGIIRQVNDLRNLILKIDHELLLHFEAEGVEFIQFLFRWMNCLLMREVSVQLIIRMWDTYLSETPLGFNLFHVYVCAAFLIKFSSELKAKDFQDILLFLQSPPTANWTENDIEVMLSEAFVWQSLYVNAGAHLR